MSIFVIRGPECGSGERGGLTIPLGGGQRHGHGQTAVDGRDDDAAVQQIVHPRTP